MPPITFLNPPPHPFWDFVAGIEDHPFFGAYARPQNGNNDSADQAHETANAQASAGQNAQGKQPAADDPPEVDPSEVMPGAFGDPREMPFRGRGRFSHAFDAGEGEGRRRGHGCRGRGAPFGGPWGRGPPGFWGRDGPHRGGPFGGPHHRPHDHHHGPRGGRHGPGRSPPREGRPHPGQKGFNLGEFLNNLGSRIGVDLTGAAENLGLNPDQYSAPRNNNEVDFEPRADIFDTPTNYTIHLSLPGAKKEDVGVDWDGEHSVLRIAGVVHRPGVDEHMLSQLVVDGRKRENGVFEKAIRLGTKRDPASVDIAGISAKMVDGVLIVKVPKVEVEHKTREVPIAGSSTSSPARNNKKDLLVDADEEMYDAPAAKASVPAPTPAKAPEVISEKPVETKEAEARDDRSETAGREEPLPSYAVEASTQEKDLSDWEKDDSEEEGEYVKINVD